MKNYLFILPLFLFTFSSCEKESIAPITIENDQTFIAKAGVNPAICSQMDRKEFVRNFNFCGIDYTLTCVLGFNNQAVNEIYAWSFLEKGGMPVDVDLVQTYLYGKMSILCDQPININFPSVYNTNLDNNGFVPADETCENCDATLIHVTYSKDITRSIERNEYLTGVFRVEIMDCGVLHKEKIVLSIKN